jgi:hypothetical protein
VEVENKDFATSGDYRNYFKAGGRYYSHILAPVRATRSPMGWSAPRCWPAPVSWPTDVMVNTLHRDLKPCSEGNREALQWMLHGR